MQNVDKQQDMVRNQNIDNQKTQNKRWTSYLNPINIFRRKKEQAETNPESQRQSTCKIVVQGNEKTEQKADRDLAVEFISAMLNNVERDRSIAALICSDEFIKVVKEETYLTPYEKEIVTPEDQWIIKGILKGGEYQNPQIGLTIKEKRNALAAKLKAKKEAIRQLDKYDTEIILATIGSKDEWLEMLYLELKDFAAKKDDKKPGEVIGGVLAFLTSEPAPLIEQKIKRYTSMSLIPREKIKEIIEKDFNKNEIEEKLWKFYDNYLIHPQADKETKNRIFYLLYGTLTNKDKEKLAFWHLETANSSFLNEKKATDSKLDESFKLYQKLEQLEEKLEKAREQNLNHLYNEMENSIKEVIDDWNNSVKRRTLNRSEEVKLLYSNYANVMNIPEVISNVNDKIKKLSNIINDNRANKFEELDEEAEKTKTAINSLKCRLYPSMGFVSELRKELEKKDIKGISRLDLLVARQYIRDPKIEIQMLPNNEQQKPKGFLERGWEIIERISYKFLKWWGVWIAIQIALALGKASFKVLGVKAIRDNIKHTYPHAMWGFLPRNIGVIINTTITRILGGILLLYIASGVYPDTLVEDLAIKLSLRDRPTIIERVAKKDDDGILTLVLKDQNGKERKITKRYIKENFGVKKNENIDYVRKQPELALYFEEVTRGERIINNGQKGKEINWILNKEHADNVVEILKSIENKGKIVKEYTLNPFDWEIRKNGAALWRWPTKTEYVLSYSQIKEQEWKLITMSYIYNKEIDGYKNKYGLNAEDARFLYKIAINYPEIAKLLTKGAAPYHIKNAAQFIQKLKNDGWKVGDELNIDLEPLPPYLEKSLDIKEMLDLDPYKIKEENVEYVISLNGKENKIEKLKDILKNIREKYTISNENDLIEIIRKSEENGLIKLKNFDLQSEAGENILKILLEKQALVEKEKKIEEKTGKRPSREEIKQNRVEEPKTERPFQTGENLNSEKKPKIKQEGRKPIKGEQPSSKPNNPNKPTDEKKGPATNIEFTF
ncbi:MAG: hypothetical protein QXF35_02480 [Candidatus Bilamarchaeaceae archaeon]